MTDINKAAARFGATVRRHAATGMTTRAAFQLAQDQDQEGATAYRLAGLGGDAESDAQGALSLSARLGESFDELAMRHATERSIPLRQAVREVAKARPDLAASRQ
jgi:hypothetical protein